MFNGVCILLIWLKIFWLLNFTISHFRAQNISQAFNSRETLSELRVVYYFFWKRYLDTHAAINLVFFK